MSVYKIENLDNNNEWYHPETNLIFDDQKWIWENVPLPKDNKHNQETLQNKSVYVSGSVSGTCKLLGNCNENQRKLNVNDKIKSCNYRTAPKIIAKYLTEIFGVWNKKPQHWLYIAQHYTPKTIIAILNQINKRTIRGEITPLKPGAYFTSIIKHKHQRKQFRNTNSSYK